MCHEERVHYLARINVLLAQYVSVIKLEDNSYGHQSQSGEAEVFFCHNNSKPGRQYSGQQRSTLRNINEI